MNPDYMLGRCSTMASSVATAPIPLSSRININQFVSKLIERPSLDQIRTATATPAEADLWASLPDDFIGLGAWVEHISAPRAGLVSALLRENLQLPQAIIEKLFEFGAVYTCPIVPKIPPTAVSKLSPAAVHEMYKKRELALASATREDLSTPPRRLTGDAHVQEHAYIRIHFSPKRFPVFHATHWPGRMVAEGPDYVVLDKPPYLPVPPTVDNVLENALAGAARAVGTTEPLLITSRLDQGTEGLVVLGKNPEFVRRFNAIVRDSGKAYRKLYRALVAVPPNLLDGHVLKHVMRVRCRHQGTPFFTLVLQNGAGSGAGAGAAASAAAAALGSQEKDAKQAEGVEERAAKRAKAEKRDGGGGGGKASKQPKTYDAELVVLGCEQVQLGATAAKRFEMGAAFEVSIELVTGRTHQIRAQLSAVGCPLLGDDLYAPLADAGLRKRLEEGDPTLEFTSSEGRRLLAEAEGAIGLQACQLEIADGRGVFGGGVEDGPVTFKAGQPWWRV